MNKQILLITFVFLFIFIQCDKNAEKRKIKLSDNIVNRNVEQQLTTTLQFDAQQRRTIAVMFFQNLTGDKNMQWLQTGLAEMFIRALSQSSSLSVLTTDRLVEILERLGKDPAPENIDMDLAAVIAKEASVEAILFGNIIKNNKGLQINVKLKELGQGEVIKQESVEGASLDNIFSMVDDLTHKIKRELHLTLEKSETPKGIADLTTNSLEAWRSYSTGSNLYEKFMANEAIPHFRNAINHDSSFVSAYLSLSSIYLNRNLTNDVLKLMDKLKTLRSQATPQEQYQIDILDAQLRNDGIAIVQTIEEWLKKYPKDRDANYTLAELYRNWNNFEEAIRYYENVRTIDPKYKLTYNILGYTYANMGDYSKAMSSLNKYKELAVDEANPYDSIGEINIWYGDYRKAKKYIKRALEINENLLGSYGNLGYLYLEKGDYKNALKSYKGLLSKSQTDVTKANAYSMIARTYYRMGKPDSAIINYDRALTKNVFNFMSFTRLLELSSKTPSRPVLTSKVRHHLNRVKELLNYDATRKNAMDFFNGLAIFHNIETEETIRLIENEIAKYEDIKPNPAFRAIVANLKQVLTLLYIQNHQWQEVEKLWEGMDVIPKELWEIMKGIRNHSYSQNWKAFSILNTGFYLYPKSGHEFYDEMIGNSQKFGIRTLEMMCRLFLANLYFHQAKPDEAHQQLKLVGAPVDKKWLVIGPFDNRDGFRKKFPPERNIKLNKTYKGKSLEFKWQLANDKVNDGFINLGDICLKKNWAVGYGLIYVNSPIEQKVQFRIGTDDGSKVWLNGKKIWTFNQGGPAIFDDNKIDVTLKQGRNKILIKVCNGIGDWGFFFRVTDKNGIGIPDITFHSAKEFL